MAVPPASRAQKVVERISARLRKEIVRGRLRPGDPLPSERDLAERYEVNRSSIREAIKRLEAWGLVSIRQGGATRVTDFLLHAGVEWLPDLVELGAKVQPGIARDLHQIRGLLLGWCAEVAAEKADPAALDRLEGLAGALAAAKGRPEAARELDYDFFQELVDITGNQLLGLLSNVLRQVYLKRRGAFLSIYEPGAFDPALHQRAVHAIRRRDAKAAGDAMRAHAARALGLEETPT